MGHVSARLMSGTLPRRYHRQVLRRGAEKYNPSVLSTSHAGSPTFFFFLNYPRSGVNNPET